MVSRLDKRKMEGVKYIREPLKLFAANIEMWWTQFPIVERIKKAKEAGFEAVEIWELDDKDIAELSAALKESDMALTQFTAWGWSKWFNDPNNLDAIIQQITEACAVAKKLNCKMGTIVGGDDLPGKTQEEMHDQIVHALKTIAPIIEANDFTLILEPMNIRVDHAGHCLYGSDAAIKICERVNSSHVRINWDLYHMQISEGDLCGHLHEGINHIGYIQLADHPGRHEPGTGEIQYNKVLSVARKLGYQNYFGLECIPSENEYIAIERLKKLQIFD